MEGGTNQSAGEFDAFGRTDGYSLFQGLGKRGAVHDFFRFFGHLVEAEDFRADFYAGAAGLAAVAVDENTADSGLTHERLDCVVAVFFFFLGESAAGT